MINETGGPNEKVSIPKPPYCQQGSGATLIYNLPAHRFNNLLPGFFNTYPNRKKVWFAVDVIKWEQSISKRAPDINRPYNEVIYGVWVKFGGQLGQHPIKFYLNDPVGIQWGRHFYASPKHLADISIDKTPNKLHAHASRDGEEVLRLDVRRRGFINSLLSPLLNTYLKRLARRYAGLYNFEKEEYRVVNLPVTMRNKASLGKVNLAYFKDPVEWGILSEEEVQKPNYTFFWEKVDMDISPPSIAQNPWDESWRSEFSLSFKQFRYFEAVVSDEAGKEYALATSILGNPLMYGEYAWITDGDRWFEVYRGNKKLNVQATNVETKDGKLSFKGNADEGWSVRAIGDEADFSLNFRPTIKPVSHTFRGKGTHYNAYVYHNASAEGEISFNGEHKRVAGVGVFEHFCGSYPRYAWWKYFSLRSPEVGIFGVVVHYGKIQEHDDRLVLVTRGGDQLYDLRSVKMDVLDSKYWRFVAQGEDSELVANVHLVKDRPTNRHQPYFKVGLGPLILARTNWLEYLAEVEGHFIENGQRTVFRGKGIAEEMDTIW